LKQGLNGAFGSNTNRAIFTEQLPDYGNTPRSMAKTPVQWSD
jgi:hypothetical protein